VLESGDICVNVVKGVKGVESGVVLSWITVVLILCSDLGDWLVLIKEK